MSRDSRSDRRDLILSAIIEDFISTSMPVGSRKIVQEWNIKVSPATIRNEMALLEEEDFIFSPHTSSGRIPTCKGYRKFVDNFLDFEKDKKKITRVFEKKLEEKKISRLENEIFDIVALLAEITGEVSFATLPKKRTFYLGISKILKKPEFILSPEKSSEIVEVLEGGDEFIDFLESLPLSPKEIKIIIGEENIIPQIKSCSLLFCQYQKYNYSSFLGVIGPTRMKYGLIHAAIDFVRHNF